MSARFLMIGLDGADGRTLDRASGDGILPNLAALRARGQAWALTSPRSATDDALWASFQYGEGVGQHGRYAFKLDPTQLQPALLEERDRETFWDRLSRQGLRVAVLDVPKCRLPRPLNGIHLADWLVHGRYFRPLPLSYPESLAAEIEARFGAAPPSECGYHSPVLDDEGVQTVRSNMLRSVAQKRAAGLHFLAAEPWDLFVIGFKEAHCSCHMFWEFADPDHARHDTARLARLGNPVLDVLKALDAAIGALVAAAGPEATVIVFSTTDFAPNGSILHLESGIVRQINRYLGTVGERLLRGLLRRCGLPFPPPFCTPLPYSDNAGALRIAHRRGDGPDGYAKRLDLITALVNELVDVDDEMPVIAAVTRPAFEQAGERADTLPHLLLHFRKNVFPHAVMSARLGRIEAPRPENIRTGNHEEGGFAFAAGPAGGVAAAEIAAMEDFGALAAKILIPAKAAADTRE